MTFLLWLLFTALAVGIPPWLIARQLTKGRGKGVEIPGKAVTWGVGSFLLVYLAVTVPWLVISWTGFIDAPWLITGLILGTPASAWVSKKWYRSFKDGNLMGSVSNRYLP
jgi:hypothetical protein